MPIRSGMLMTAPYSRRKSIPKINSLQQSGKMTKVATKFESSITSRAVHLPVGVISCPPALLMLGPLHGVSNFLRRSASSCRIIEKSAPVSTSAVTWCPSIITLRSARTNLLALVLVVVVVFIIPVVTSSLCRGKGVFLASRRLATLPPEVAAVSFSGTGLGSGF